MGVDDFVFKDVCDLLRKNRINFWICHGTLLGIIRENRLLPWDHDIDFAVWDHETDKNYKTIKNNFNVTAKMKEMGLLDINLDLLA